MAYGNNHLKIFTLRGKFFVFSSTKHLLEPVTCAARPSFSARSEQGLGGKERWGGREETHPGRKYPLGVRAGGAQLKGSASLLLTRGESPHTRQ